MDSGILISLILGITSIISSIFFGLIPTIRKKKLLRLEEKVQHLLWDVKLLYEIENELLNRLEEHGNKKRSLKTEVRRIISEKNNGRVLSDDVKPSVYAKQIKY